MSILEMASEKHHISNMIRLSIDISVITNNQEIMFNLLFLKNYNAAIGISMRLTTLHELELRLVKGLCQKYTATLGCHSTFA